MKNQPSGSCKSDHQCQSHASGHVHGESCGHKLVPHDGHSDFLVESHLHHPHDGHCDNHGKFEPSAAARGRKD